MDPINDKARSSYGLIAVMNNEQIDAYEAEQRETDPAFQKSQVVNALAGYIDSCWQANKTAKQPIETILLQCLRQRNGEYDPEVLQKLEAQGETDPVYMMVTDIKCRAAISWIKDAMIPPGEVPFRFDHTPIPELPEALKGLAKMKIVAGLQAKVQETGIDPRQLDRESVMEVGEQVKKEMSQMLTEQAKAGAEQMTTRVNDELVEGGWYEGLAESIDDFVTYPTAFCKGPVPRKKKVLEWTDQGPQAVAKIVKEYQRVSPFDIYPSSGAKTLDDGNLIERIRYSPSDLQAMIGVEGYDETAIREVLNSGGYKQWLSIDNQRDLLEDRHNETGDPETRIDCLRFMGSVKGSMLIEWGMKEIGDPDISYPVTCMKIGPHVISARINDHPLGRRGYYYASFIRKVGSIWGRGVPQVMRDLDRLCNGAARAIVRNMAIASGPQAWVNESRLAPGQDASKQWPWKVWKFTDGEVKNRSDIPMGYFFPPSVTQELLAIYKHFYDQASEVTGIPAYVYGSEKIGGAGSTAAGLSMLMNASAKGLRNSVTNIDAGIVKKSVEEHWLQLMLTDPENAVGDVKVVARASDYLMQLEQLQLATYDALQLTNNQTDLQIMGLEGRGEMLREYLKRLKIPIEKIIPDRDSIITKTSDQRFAMLVENLAKAMGADPQRLLAIAQGVQG